MEHAPCTKKLTLAMTNEINAPQERISFLSDTHDTSTVMTKAIAYGGTVNNCAFKPVYPKPDTIVGENSEILENGTEIEM